MKLFYLINFLLISGIISAQPKVKEYTPSVDAEKMLNTTKLKRLAKNKNICVADVSVTFITRSNWSSTKSKGPNEVTSKAYFVLDSVQKETFSENY